MIDQDLYSEEIASIAKDIAQDCLNDEYDINDLTHERVDGHSWIIYYKYNNWVLEYSNNPEAIFDQGMEESLTHAGSVKDLLQVCAYWAMVNDVYELAQEYYEQLKEEQEENDEDEEN
jgi:hypothetical protein